MRKPPKPPITDADVCLCFYPFCRISRVLLNISGPGPARWEYYILKDSTRVDRISERCSSEDAAWESAASRLAVLPEYMNVVAMLIWEVVDVYEVGE
jgi:hypothetical protein